MTGLSGLPGDRCGLNKKSANGKNQNDRTLFVLKGGAISSKIEGLNGLAFTVVLSTNVIKMAYKT